MTGVVVIGRTLADARSYAEKYSIVGPTLISPASSLRFRGLRVSRFFVTREAFEHPQIVRTVLTAQTIMRHQGD